jgi:hypothetical protein
MSYPTWVWLYFGIFGTIGAVLYTLVVWYWMKFHSMAAGMLRSAAKWNMLGLMFLFIAAYFACGIGGPPGSMLSSDPLSQNIESAYDSALLAIFFSVPGWACVFVGIRKLFQKIRSQDGMSFE